jgi:hypothetical protein
VIKHWLATVGLGLALALTAPAPLSASDELESEHPSELARDGMERLMRALEAFIGMIPQYEMPVFNENGDIIIRRKREPDTSREPADDEDLEQTQT